MTDYNFVIKLHGSVSAINHKEAEAKINAHLDDLGEIDSSRYDLGWPEVSWELESEVC